MLAAELIGFWAAVAAWAVATLAATGGLVLGRDGWVRAAGAAAATGVAGQVAALLARGLGGWGPPFTTYYESVLFGTLLAGGALMWLGRTRPPFRAALVVAAPVILLLLGSAVFTAREFEPLSPTLQSWWLVVHVLFALAAFGAMLVAAGLAGVVLVPGAAARWLPATGADGWLVRAFSLAFVFQLVMVASGSIWAHQAWGRAWGWDPIETCSLLVAIVLGLALHLHRLHGWRGGRLAWLAIGAFLLTAYGIWGVPFFQPSVHLYQGPRGPGGG